MGRGQTETPRQLPKRDAFGLPSNVQIPDTMLRNSEVRKRIDDPRYSIDRGVPMGERPTKAGDLSTQIASHRMRADQTDVRQFRDKNNQNKVDSTQYEQDRKKIIYNLKNRA